MGNAFCNFRRATQGDQCPPNTPPPWSSPNAHSSGPLLCHDTDCLGQFVFEVLSNVLSWKSARIVQPAVLDRQVQFASLTHTLSHTHTRQPAVLDRHFKFRTGTGELSSKALGLSVCVSVYVSVCLSVSLSLSLSSLFSLLRALSLSRLRALSPNTYLHYCHSKI